MKEELKKECQTCGSDNCHAWEAELAELLDENKPTKIRDFVRFLLAKQQEEFVSKVRGMLMDDSNHNDYYYGYNDALNDLLEDFADIKSKLNK
jgi:hypothetical protein